jgi:2-methylaconitate cis-trans-isomerase PrpF
MAVMGSGHELEIDGVGGGNPLSSKVALVDRSATAEADVDYLFAQVGVAERFVDTSPNCGNMLVAVGPFAIETGLVAAVHPETTVRIRNVNTNTFIDAIVQTPHGVVTYSGPTVIDGVPGRSAPVKLTFKTGAGSKTGKLLPTDRLVETIDGIEVSLFDMSVPVMMLAAESLGKTGREMPAELDADKVFLARLEAMRGEAGRRMGLGDVSGSVLPKVIMVSRPANGGSIAARYFMPHSCHRAFAATGGVCLATACVTAGTVASRYAERRNENARQVCRIEHPSGYMEIEVEMDQSGAVVRSSLIRTARKLVAGALYVPDVVAADWQPDGLTQQAGQGQNSSESFKGGMEDVVMETE